MGGGDLNLKKSWHPLTMQNLERVWKAEQRHSAEQKRIAELQAEIKEERARDEMQQMAVEAGVIKAREERVDWLYRGPGTVNREEYLLGKPIDKAVDPTLIEEEREKEALASGPGALFVSGSSAGTTADLEVKIREDPLFLIRKNEEQAKKKLLDNPIRMKQLHQILQKSKSKKHKHKSEKKSKKKKSHHHHDNSSDSEPEDDSRQRHKREEFSRHKRRDRSPDRRFRDRSPISQRNHSPLRHSRSSDFSRGSRHYNSREGSGNHRGSGGSSVTRKMDPKELERRRQEMMSSARERDSEREKRVRQHQDEVKKEEDEAKRRAGEDFLKPMRVQSLTSSSTLEDRIHRNINSVQRTRTALNDKFLKR